jgi:DNA invertase Pin-like site-specific DNA recombinase
MNTTNTAVVAYYRVSTQRQGQQGYGLEAQRMAVKALLDRLGFTLSAEFTEVESGAKSDRPQLQAALTEARNQGAVLCVAKLDRLARDVELIASLVKEAERNGFGGLLFADFPDVDPRTPEGELFINQMAAFAQFERRRISQRTRAGLAVRRARGGAMGALLPHAAEANARRAQEAQQQAQRLANVILPLRAQELSHAVIAARLQEAGVPSPSGKPWGPMAVSRVLKRLQQP